ncbi:DUF4391 domain-containing protein [Corallibacter sp.]|uniref:DUF4391 domain-containing protein n=1 Tax=Corallibacter sp. TaxID=2038084 RepID=UPI003AB8B7AE
MSYFNLPPQARKKSIVPKHAFDASTNSKQKQLLVDVVERITWEYELAPDTINLSGEKVKRLQVFKIVLKRKNDFEKVITIIEKASPYHIIYEVVYIDEVLLYTSQKHPHPLNENNAVIDWVFKTDWFVDKKEEYQLDLKVSLDKVFEDFCFKISNNSNLASEEDLKSLIEKEQKIQELKTQITKLEAQIKRTKQFNKKLPLNSQLNLLNSQLNHLV